MLPAMSEGVDLGKPHVDHKCHVDPYLTDLYVSIECTLTQGFKTDEDGEVIRDDDGNPIRKPAGIIHLGHDHDPVMMVRVGLRGPLLHHLCGKLCVRVHLECIGEGPEEDYSTDLPIEGEDGRKCCGITPDEWCYYDFEVTIPQDDFEATEDYEPGCGEFCCFAVTATTLDRCGNPGHIGCWCKGPCVMIHEAPEA